ncbi:GAP family protein [Leucobacter sp. NPDC058333]|uniref:GAP family protein n=1 Tax=Leucobacter sp. NPDC058333 TaxID=3346450 RepID=UPI003660ADA1
MDMLTTLPLPLALAILALLDGLSTGTLLIPVFLLLAPGRLRAGRILLYLGVITAFYFVVGVACLLGLVNVIDAGQRFLASPAGGWAMLAAGAALFLVGLWLWYLDVQNRKRGIPGGGRLLVWRERLLSDESGRGNVAVIAVALAAGLSEVATMLPYLVGMTMLADAPMSMGSRLVSLAGYCVVMIVPALLLLLARAGAARAVEEPLARFAAWMQRTGLETSSWLFCILGVLIARTASQQLQLDLPIIG